MTRIGSPLVDTDRQIQFWFDGKPLTGFAGDSLASALLANDVRVVGRSFKYHRPRGIFGDGSEEPNALFQIGKDAAQTPNIRATEVEIFDGMMVTSQNRFPNLNFDVLAINDLFAPFFGAGFYYKTFMWPKKFWERVYEPIIRRAAGLGALSGADDRAKYERGFLFCDLLIIGGGLAGLWSALIAAESGADVILVEGDHELGGRLIRDQGMIGGKSYREWRDDMLGKLSKFPNLRIMTRTHVTGVYDGGIYGALERVGEHQPDDGKTAQQCFWRIAAAQSILAAGAIERPIAFQNNDRPGIMLASAVRGYANRFGVLAGQKIAIFTNNDDGWKTAHDLAALGHPPVAVIDSRPDQNHDVDYPVHCAKVINTKGRKGLKSIRLDDGTVIDCDVLAVSGGWNPNVHLTCHLGARPQWNDDIQAFIPSEEAVAGLDAIGAAAGDFVDADIFKQTTKITQTALKAIGKDAKNKRAPKASDAPYHITPLWHVPGEGRAWLDLQNDVSVKDVKLAFHENMRSVEHMKRYTTLGMATDQGKTANVNALAIMAELTGQSIPETGTTTYRPPLVPVGIGVLGAGSVGKGFQPERYIPTHDFSVESGAQMVEAGLWYRPSYFPKFNETNWRQSCDREVGYVRNSVGVTDVSTLGKIDIQGPDAAAFLNLIYSGKMSTLKPGRIRYGIMLREDGMVMDDGTCAYVDEDHYRITTTTVAAGAVMMHIEFVHQCLAPHMRVSYISTTDHFAQIAVAGPKSRDVLNEIVDGDISDEALPFMALKSVKIGGIDAQIFRISFSGELGYEIAVPREYGDDLIRVLAKAAEQRQGGVYGLEALNVLRIEKGFITHNEIHGRIGAYDVGLEKMISPSKDCIGRVMAARPGLVDDQRERLVGIRPIGAVQKLLAGSRMVAVDNDPIRENLEGYVTSVCYSPTLGHMIGLAFLRDGKARIGEQIRAVDLVRDFDTLCEIVDPVFFDPEGERLRG